MVTQENQIRPPIILTQEENHESTWGYIILLLLIFPPYAFYLMYTQHTYHAWLAYSLWFFSVGLLIFTIQFSSSIAILPPSYSELSASPSTNFLTILRLLTIGIIIVSSVVAIFLKIQTQKLTGATPGIRLFAVILLLIMSALPYLFFLNFVSPIYSLINNIRQESTLIDTPNHFTIPPSTSPVNPTANWKTYDDSQFHFSFKYPATWSVERQLVDNGLYGSIWLKGQEGTLHVGWGNGFDGGCDEKDHKDIVLFGQIKNICNAIKSDGIEYWGQIYKRFDKTNSLSLSATANAPTEQNRKVILEIFDSFIFH